MHSVCVCLYNSFIFAPPFRNLLYNYTAIIVYVILLLFYYFFFFFNAFVLPCTRGYAFDTYLSDNILGNLHAAITTDGPEIIENERWFRAATVIAAAKKK